MTKLSNLNSLETSIKPVSYQEGEDRFHILCYLIIQFSLIG